MLSCYRATVTFVQIGTRHCKTNSLSIRTQARWTQGRSDRSSPPRLHSLFSLSIRPGARVFVRALSLARDRFEKDAVASTTARSSDENDGDPAASPPKETLRRIASISRPEMKLIGGAAATLGVTSSVTLLLPYLSGKVIDAAIIAASDSAISTAAGGDFSAMPVALGLFGLTAIAGVGVYVRSVLLTTAGNRIVSRLRHGLFASVLAQDAAYFDTTLTTGDVLSRLSADAQLVQAAVTTHAVSALRGAVMSAGAAAMLFQTSATLAVVSLATLPPVLLSARAFGRSLRDRQAAVQAMHAGAIAAAEEIVSGIKTVRQFDAELRELGRYSKAVRAAHEEAIQAGRLQAAFDGGVHVAANGAVLCVLAYGGTMVLDGTISAGDLTGFLMYSLLMAGNISSLSSTYADMMKSVAAAGRVFHVVDRKPAIPPTFDPDVVAAEINGQGEKGESSPNTNQWASATAETEAMIRRSQLSVEFRNVTFAYPSRPDSAVIGPGFSLMVRAGEFLALVGGSGSGKSTVAALLTRLYDVTPIDDDDDDGAVMIDGHDVRTLNPAILRRCVGIVSQEPLLFSTTIEENIRYGKFDATDQEVREAARIAHVLDFAETFPDGMRTFVGSRGTQLSGGQKQRVAIARIILKNPQIVVLDEATSALDAESEFHVKHAIDTVMKGRTVISIAHRLSTIRGADRVAVLKSGRIVEIGTFDDLTNREDGAFRELMGRQLVLDE